MRARVAASAEERAFTEVRRSVVPSTISTTDRGPPARRAPRTGAGFQQCVAFADIPQRSTSLRPSRQAIRSRQARRPPPPVIAQRSAHRQRTPPRSRTAHVDRRRSGTHFLLLSQRRVESSQTTRGHRFGDRRHDSHRRRILVTVPELPLPDSPEEFPLGSVHPGHRPVEYSPSTPNHRRRRSVSPAPHVPSSTSALERSTGGTPPTAPGDGPILRPPRPCAPVPPNASEKCAEVHCTDALERLLHQYSMCRRPVPVNFRKLVPFFSGIDRATHLFHSYPAKLLLNIPFFFLHCQQFGRPLHLFDPFCGSGTVLVEGALRGCWLTGADANPLLA